MRLEPLSPAHEDGLWEASRDARTWQWLSVEQPQTREEMRAYLDAALANQADGRSCRRDGAPRRRPRRRQHPLPRAAPGAPEHRDRLDVADPEAWGTGVNIEAKLLMLEHAFERSAASASS